MFFAMDDDSDEWMRMEGRGRSRSRSRAFSEGSSIPSLLEEPPQVGIAALAAEEADPGEDAGKAGKGTAKGRKGLRKSSQPPTTSGQKQFPPIPALPVEPASSMHLQTAQYIKKVLDRVRESASYVDGLLNLAEKAADDLIASLQTTREATSASSSSHSTGH
jgi:hypothetical protein